MDFPWNSFSLPRREERRHPWSKASWRWGDRQSNDRVQGACWALGQRQLDAQRKPHQDQESGLPSWLCPSATGSSGASDLQLPGSFFSSTVKWE